MSDKKTGGPAFPQQKVWDASRAEYADTNMYPGMDLRDYFAAKAMQGICAHHDTWGLVVDEIASQSYAMADAMLKARDA